MLIVDYKSGQLANRLFLFSYFAAHALEYKYKLINPCFDEYTPLFTATSVNKFQQGNISVNFSGNQTINSYIQDKINSLRRRAKQNNGRYMGCVFYDIREGFDQVNKGFEMNSPAFIKLVKRRILFAKGWNYRDHSALLKHASVIRNFFIPQLQYVQQVNKIIADAKETADILIGVHLRKGDYKDFFNGRWLYDDEVYAIKIDQLKNLPVFKGKRLIFILCSDEKIDNLNFQHLNVSIQHNDAVVDLYTLASCDYLIGPPSTFTMWASFYGKVPLLMLKDKSISIELTAFKITEGVESFF